MVLSMVKFRWYFNTVLKFIPVLLAYTLFSEILGLLVRDYDSIRLLLEDEYRSYNFLIFNIYYIVFFIYFFSIFFSVSTIPKNKTFIKYAGLAYIVSILINPFFHNPLLLPQLYSQTLGSLVLAICALQYIREFRLMSKPENGRYVPSILFWISLGLLAFYPFYPIFTFLGFHYDLYIKYHIRLLQHISIALMYSFFIIGFIKTRRSVIL